MHRLKPVPACTAGRSLTISSSYIRDWQDGTLHPALVIEADVTSYQQASQTYDAPIQRTAGSAASTKLTGNVQRVFEDPASLSEGTASPRQLPLLTDPATILSGALLAPASGEGITPCRVTLAARYKLDSNDGVLLPGLVTAAQSSRGQAQRRLHKPLIKQQVCGSEPWV